MSVASKTASTIANTKIPLAYKQMLIKSLVLPTLLYGSEIFGMNENRMNNLTRVADNLMKNLTKKHNYCRKRVYEELEVKRPYIYAAISRSRCFTKMKESNGVINELINNSRIFKSKKKTWVTNTMTWLKKNKIDMNLNTKETVHMVQAAVDVKQKKRNKSIIGTRATRYGWHSGKELIKAELFTDVPTLGLAMMFKIRTGTFRSTNEMIVTGKINPEYRNRCILCGTNTAETIEHLLLDCNALNVERDKYLTTIISEINGLSTSLATQRKLTQKVLLGGEMPAFGRKPAEIIPSVAKYLSALVVKRSAKIAEIKTTKM